MNSSRQNKQTGKHHSLVRIVARLVMYGVTILALTLISPFNSSVTSAAPLSSNLSQRYVIFLDGINSSSTPPAPLNNDFKDIEDHLRTIGVSRFIYFSYGAGAGNQVGDLYCGGWENGCSASTLGDLTSLDLVPIYTSDATHLNLDLHRDALDWLLGQIVRQDLNAQIDLVGYSLGGIVASYWASIYGGTSTYRDNIHSIVIIESPVGGIPIAGECVQQPPPAPPRIPTPLCDGVPLVFKGLIDMFGTDVLRQLQLPQYTGSIVDSLPQAARNFPFTSIQSKADYFVNDQTLTVDIPVYGPTPTAAIGRGTQYWGAHTQTLHNDVQLGLSGLATGVVDISEVEGLLRRNHTEPLHPIPGLHIFQTGEWVSEAIQTPIVPSLLSPANGSSTSLRPTFDWTDVDTKIADSYILAISQDPLLATYDMYETPQSIFTLTNDLVSGQTYYWSVFTKHGDNIIKNPEIWHFTASDNPPQGGPDDAKFIADVTIPDGMSVSPGQAMKKIWRLQNNGQTTWVSGYQLAFVGKDQMGAPSAVPIPHDVAPGETVDISVNMTAPSASGNYEGDWQMRNAQGALFGQVVWIKINVGTPQTSNWHAEYFDRKENWDNPSCSTEDMPGPTLDKDWGGSGPCGRTDDFSARFTGTFNFPAGKYVFRIKHDDGAKLYIRPQGQSVWQNIWDSGTSGEYPVCSLKDQILSGNYELRVDYWENAGGASVHLDWTTDTTPCNPPPPPPCYTLTTTANPADAGTITRDIQPDCNNNTGYSRGKVVTLTPHAAPGYYFVNWSGCGDSSNCQLTMDGDKTVVANFGLCYTLTWDVDPPGSGTINPALSATGCGDSHKYKPDDVVTLQAIPYPGYAFNGWSGEVSDPGIRTPSVTMNGDKTVVVQFVADSIRPTASITSITPLFNNTYLTNNQIEIKVTASDNRGVTRVAFFVGYNNSPTVFAPGANPAAAAELAIQSQFVPPPPPPPLGGTGGSDEIGVASVLAGVTAQDYWHFLDWDDNGADGWSKLWDSSAALDQRAVSIYVYAYDEAQNPSAGAGRWNLFLERKPPESHVSALENVSLLSFLVKWSGADAEAGSGIVGYNVQYRDNGGAWINWKTNAIVTAATFIGLNGHTYEFRSQARDRAGNVEAWPDAPDATTTASVPPAAPILLSPANNGLATDYKLAFDWSDVPTTTSYHIQVATDKAFTVMVWDTTGPASSFETALTPNTLYYWRVQAIKAVSVYSQFGAWSAVRSLRAAILRPELSLPDDGIVQDTTRPDFSWGNVAGAASYTIQIANNSAFITPVVNAVANTPAFRPLADLPRSKLLYWRVRANGPNGPSLWSEVRSFTSANPPSVPILVLPANGSLTTNYTPLLNWNDSTLFPHHYELQVATDIAFSALVVDELNLDMSEFAVPSELTPNTRYYWHVRSVNAANQHSLWSAVFSFRTALPRPILDSPGDGAMLTTLRPPFGWGAVIGAASYTLQVSTNPTFVTLNVNVTATQSPYKMTVDLPRDKVMFWRVRSNGVNGPSAWSEVRSFTSANSPNAPAPLTPANGAVVASILALTWSAPTVPAGTVLDHYEVQISVNSNFNTVEQEDNIVMTSYLVAPLSAGTHYWRVRAVNTAGQYSNWSVTRSFRVP